MKPVCGLVSLLELQGCLMSRCATSDRAAAAHF
jgi:hypothetical protein